MEIKDKITVRQVAMQLATETMCAIIKKEEYDINEHIKLAKILYDWIIGNADIPEVYNINEQTENMMNAFLKIQGKFKPEPLWLPIYHENGKIKPVIIDLMRKSIPISIRSKDGVIKIIGSVEELDKIAESEDVLNYKDYSFYI